MQDITKTAADAVAKAKSMDELKAVQGIGTV